MELLIFIPAVFIFFYSLYNLVKDDYILIRKNITIEAIFDIAFICSAATILFSRVFFFISHTLTSKNVLLLFFSRAGGLSLMGAIVGGTFCLYFLSKYRKIPLGRLFDFFILALVVSLPFGFLGYTLIFFKTSFIFGLVNAVLYVFLWVLFFRVLYPKFMNRTLREGTISLLFFIIFSVSFFLTHSISSKLSILQVITFENVLAVVILLVSCGLFIKQEQGRGRKRG